MKHFPQSHKTVSGLALAVSGLLVLPAWAGGGAGGAGYSGAGGSTGIADAGGAGVGTGSSASGAGGGGGAGITGGQGGNSWSRFDAPPGGAGGATPGASGSDGSLGINTGSGGGGGAHGGVGTSLPDAAVSGGNGGNGAGVLGGAPSGINYGGGGGEGGWGWVVTGGGNLGPLDASVTGGNGGNGGDANGFAGNGGDGGIGLYFMNGATATINAAVTGGNGGAGGTGLSISGSPGSGGAGIVGSNLALTITGTGSINAGLSGSGARANAITFTGGANTLVLQTGASLTGNIAINGGGTLTFDQTDAYTLANSITGDGRVIKTGAQTLTLTGTNTHAGGTLISSGALQIGNGGTTGSIAGNITNNATLIFNRSDASVYSGVISGSGSLEKQGTGTLTLTGAHTYTGPTRISMGTLLLDGGSISGGGNVLIGNTAGDNGALTIQAAGSATSLNAVVGNVAGSTGAATVTGGSWTSNALTVGWSGSGTLDISNGGRVTSSLVALGWAAGGDGTLNLGAAGVLETGRVSRGSGTGTFNLDGGTLRATADNSDFLSGFDASDVRLLSNSTVDTRTHNIGIAAALSGAGGLVKQGMGTLLLSGANTYTGTTTVNAGTLIINGSNSGNGSTDVLGGRLIVGGDAAHSGASLSGNVSVANGATLGGHGSINGDVSVANGGGFAPGNSIGITTVNGNLMLSTGSITHIELSGGGNTPGVHHDQILASTATISNGARFRISPVNGDRSATTGYAGGRTYTLIATTGGITVNGSQHIADDYAYLDFTGSFDANNYYITSKMASTSPSFCLPGHSANQCATGKAAFSLGAGNQVYDAVLNLTRAQSDDALNQLSGEIRASAQTAMIEDSRYVRNAANDRLRAAFAAPGASRAPALTYVAGNGPVSIPASHDGPTFWSQAYGGWGSTSGNANTAYLSRSSGGVFLGADAPVSDVWRVGAFTGYGGAHFDADDRRASGSSNDYHLGVYGGAVWNRLALRTGAAYTWHHVSTSRRVDFPGYTDRLKGDYHAGTAQVFGELGYAIPAGENARIEPYLNLAHVHAHAGRYNEHGGAAALTGKPSDNDVTFATLGLHAERLIDIGRAQASLTGTLGWRHAFGDVEPTVRNRFVGTNAFTIAGAPIARNSAVLEAGLDFRLSASATLGLAYTGQLASGARDHGAQARLTMRF